VIARSVLPTDSGALTEFVRGMRGARHVTFEEGTQAQWLYELLAPLVDRVVVCDRRGAPRQGNKGDQVDATTSPSCCAAGRCARSIMEAPIASRSKSSRGPTGTWSKTRPG